jgi:hypothetical protein
MPVRSETGKAKRLNQKIIENLRELVRSGVPWVQPGDPLPRGYCDLLALVTGLFYFTDFIRITNPKHGAEEDRETQLFLWSELRQDIIDEHIKHRPGTRPWSWWHLEDRELQREGESEASYLKRLRLLLPGERSSRRKI